MCNMGYLYCTIHQWNTRMLRQKNVRTRAQTRHEISLQPALTLKLINAKLNVEMSVRPFYARFLSYARLINVSVSQQSSMSIKKIVEGELQTYQEIPPAIMSEDPAAWWWNQRKTYPLLADLAFSYLCVQAWSTPSERVFSTAGDTISPECSRLLPEKADMIIFLNKNCF